MESRDGLLAVLSVLHRRKVSIEDEGRPTRDKPFQSDLRDASAKAGQLATLDRFKTTALVSVKRQILHIFNTE